MTTASITHTGLDAFAAGRFDDGGSNLYVNAKGEIERIHRTDLTGDGIPDIVVPNTHGHIDRGPTRVFSFAPEDLPGPAVELVHRDLPNDSGWLSRAVDLDGDGHLDLVVANAENGVTSELPLFIYWGGPSGLTGERTELPTAGGYDALPIDVDGDGRLDLIVTSAWTDHHNPADARPLQVWRQVAPRRFEEATATFGLTAVGSMGLATGDVTGSGRLDLVVACYRSAFDLATESLVFRARPPAAGGGWEPEPLRLPTRGASQVRVADLDGDGHAEAIFAGGDQVRIYWGGPGGVSPERSTTLKVPGMTGQFRKGSLAIEVADVDGDGRPELLIATRDGVQIRRGGSAEIEQVAAELAVPFANWLHAADLDGDGRPELIVSVYEDGARYEAESFILWNGEGGLSVDGATRLPTAGAMGCIAADLDGDGRPEIVVNCAMQGPTGHWADFPVFVYPSANGADGRPHYDPDRRLDLPSAGETYAYVIADLDLDGHADLVLGRLYGVRIFRGGPDGPRPDDWYELPLRTGICIQVHVADLNRDGWLDIVAICQTYDGRPETRANSSVIFWGSPEGYSAERSTVLPTYSTGGGYLADVDRDGFLDLITAEKTAELVIHHGGPAGLQLDHETRVALPIHGMPDQVTAADLDGDGWLDLVVGISGHYARSRETLFILWGGPDGYSAERSTRYDAGFSPGQPSVAHLAGDEASGQVSLIVPAYSSADSRTLPWEIVPVRGRALDTAGIRRFPGFGSCHVMPVDLDGDGWTDLVVANHRRDEIHDADTVIYWGGPDGVSEERTTRLPGWGPHYLTMRDPGNALDRGPIERYESPPLGLGAEGARIAGVTADADVPDGTELTIDLRVADDEAGLANATWGPAPTATGRWAQYRASFGSRTGARSPRLRAVHLEFAP